MSFLNKKKCTKCLKNKPFGDFAKDKYSKDGLTFRCKSCRNEQYNDYYKKSPEKQKNKNDSQKINRLIFYNSERGVLSSRRAHLKRNFNLDIKDYDKLNASQNGLCAICNEPETYYRNKVLSVDHDHETGRIRGLLCNTCNRALGLLKDNKNVLINAIKYLEKHEL